MCLGFTCFSMLWATLIPTSSELTTGLMICYYVAGVSLLGIGTAIDMYIGSLLALYESMAIITADYFYGDEPQYAHYGKRIQEIVHGMIGFIFILFFLMFIDGLTMNDFIYPFTIGILTHTIVMPFIIKNTIKYIESNNILTHVKFEYPE